MYLYFASNCVSSNETFIAVGSFENFTAVDGSPIYQQILLFIKRGAVAGSILHGDELPSRRMLSALLGINPNTVQKAFKLLEEEGLIESRAGAKSTMKLSPEKIKELKKELVYEDLKLMILALKQTGIVKEEAVTLMQNLWEEG